MPFKKTLWSTALLAFLIFWGYAMDTIFHPEQTGFMNHLGAALGMSIPVYLVTGVFALIVYFLSKRNSNAALWTWTTSALILLTLLGIGAAKIATS